MTISSTNSNDDIRATLDIHSHELSIVKTCVALTMSACFDAQRKRQDTSVSLDMKVLEQLYCKLDALSVKLGKQEEEAQRKE